VKDGREGLAEDGPLMSGGKIGLLRFRVNRIFAAPNGLSARRTLRSSLATQRREGAKERKVRKMPGIGRQISKSPDAIESIATGEALARRIAHLH
jgi:hypothetical protein